MKLYIASTSEYAGKTLLALALGTIWGEAGVKVGYVKPLGKIPMMREGRLVDGDATFLADALVLDAPPEAVCPVVITQDLVMAAWRGEELHLRGRISAAVRDAALDALLPSLIRRSSSALSASPPASTSAFLHSIMGASVLSRSSLTMPAVISVIPETSPEFLHKKRGCRPSFLRQAPGSLRSRAGFFDLDELVRGRADDLLHGLVAPFEDRIGDSAGVQADRAA